MPNQAAIFIVGGYFDKILLDAKPFHNWLFDYEKFSDYLCTEIGLERFRTYYYNAPPYRDPQPTPAQRRWFSQYARFIQYLRSCSRFQVREGKLIKYPVQTCRSCGAEISCPDCGQIPPAMFKQKGTDIYLAMDLVQLSATNRTTRDVLISG